MAKHTQTIRRQIGEFINLALQELTILNVCGIIKQDMRIFLFTECQWKYANTFLYLHEKCPNAEISWSLCPCILTQCEPDKTLYSAICHAVRIFLLAVPAGIYTLEKMPLLSFLCYDEDTQTKSFNIIMLSLFLPLIF